MLRARLTALVTLALLTGGALLTILGYAGYWRSAWYRARCASALSSKLGLPSAIGAVVPRSHRSREFRDVRIWLPQHRDEAAYCASATVIRVPTPTDPEAYELVLRGGRSEISTRTWLREDYRFVLESGLRPGFDPNGPRRVTFSDMDLTFQREQFRAALHDATGIVSFDDARAGHASIACHDFNGHLTPQPVLLEGRFSPQPRGIRLDQIEIAIPELPVALAGLTSLAGLDLRSGAFSGRITYRELPRGAPVTWATSAAFSPQTLQADGPDQRILSVSGRLTQLLLAECTAGFVRQPWHGTVPELQLDELQLVDNHLQSIRFRGTFTGVVLGDLLASWGLDAVGGNLLLRVHSAELSPAGIERFVASGRCENLSLEQLTAALGWGRLAGTGQLQIDDFTIVQNRLVSCDATLRALPGGPAANYIERALLSSVLSHTLGLELPSFLPERFEYTQLGLRLEVRDEMLHVFGTHGTHGKTLLTVMLAEREIPVLSEPEQAFDLRPQFDTWRPRLLAELRARLPQLTPADAWRALLARRNPPPPPANSQPRPPE